MNPTPEENSSTNPEKDDESGPTGVRSKSAVDALNEVYEVTTDTDLSFEAKINRLLSIGVAATGLPYGFLSQITVEDSVEANGTQTIVEAIGSHELLQPGESAPLSRAYCRKTINAEDLVAIQNASDSGWENDPAYETYELESYIGGKVVVGEQLYGTFCFASREAKEQDFTDEEQTLVRVLSKWASYELKQERAHAELESQRDRLKETQDELRQIIDLVPDLIFAKNREGEYILANAATAEALGLTPAEVEGAKEPDLIPELSQSEALREDDRRVIESGESHHIPEENLTTAAGDTRTFQTEKIPFETAGSGTDAVLGYARDITEIKEYERELETQRDNLNVLNQVVRHDIRNDLQLVMAYADTLIDYVDGEAETYIQKLLEAARDAVDITGTAREMTEVMLQSAEDLSSRRLQPVLRKEVDNLRSSQKQVDILVDGGIPDIEVRADDLLNAVFRNLLKNAILHNDKEVPETTVSAEIVGECVEVRISDNGPGIPDDQKAVIFQEGAQSLESPGTGLGLYLVQTLVERYSGEIWVEDNQPQGAEFVVQLPLSG